jgi:hypothetical protein
MKNPLFSSPSKCLGFMTLLMVLTDQGLCGSPMIHWEPAGLSGGGGMFSPAISPADPNLMMLNCDMSAAYLSQDGGHHWRMINHSQLKSDTRCRPGFHPSRPDVIYASSGGRLRISRDQGHSFVPIGNLKESLYGEIAINPCKQATAPQHTFRHQDWI